MPAWGRDLIRVRKTIVFLNSSTDVPVFDVTGRVLIIYLTAFCTDNIVEDGAVAGIVLGTVADRNVLITTINPSEIAVNEWWTGGASVTESIQMSDSQKDVLISANIILTITGGIDLDSGTIIFDVWYYPITDDGALVAA